MRPAISPRTLLVSALSLLAPAAAGLAQSSHAIAFHVGRDDALPMEATMGGLSYTTWSGSLGVRASGSLALGQVNQTENNVDGTWKITAWTADADAILSPFRGGDGGAGLHPFAFGGIGGHGARYTTGQRAAVATLSYGWGVALNFSRTFGLEGTARRRTLLQDDVQLPPGFANAWEYRAGISFEFGGPKRAVKTRRTRRVPEPVHGGGDDRDDRPPVLATPAPVAAASVSVASVIRTANRYEGIRYSYGGASPTRGFDCSGFVQYVFSRHGVALPRTSRQIAELGEPVPLNRDDLREGDLLFFAGNGTRIDHVAIYLGDDQMIHSTASGGGVRIESLTSARGEWFDRRMVAARRLLGGRGIDRQRDELDERPEPFDPPDKAPPPAR
jgi:cell wall-associated NlpC family hydrolase